MTDKKQSNWIAHVKAYREANPELTYKQAMTEARSTYTKSERKKTKANVEQVGEGLVIPAKNPDDRIEPKVDIKVIKPVRKKKVPVVEQVEPVEEITETIESFSIDDTPEQEPELTKKQSQKQRGNLIVLKKKK